TDIKQEQLLMKQDITDIKQEQLLMKQDITEMKQEQQQIKLSVLETNERTKEIAAKQDEHEQLIHLLGMRSLKQEAELNRMK
ncbi:hypothetical protein P5F75_00495, partial [Caldifermentibacillus hisashii]|nr:hypothetical protein [Caldifermentibacillus hisashii]